MRVFALICALWLSGSASAECLVTYVRTACPGMEAESYKKCGGSQTCIKSKPAASVLECQARAFDACRNFRYDITESKVITATYNGEEILTPLGEENFCNSDEFEHLDTDFYRCDG